MSTYRHCAVARVQIDNECKHIAEYWPAEVTVDKGNLSLEARNDIRNGTRDIWLIAFIALFDVSLIYLSVRGDIVYSGDSREAP